MDAAAPSSPHALAPDEKLTPVMVYTPNSVVRGQVVTKQGVRVNIWLRTVGAPEYIHMKQAQIITFGGNGPFQPVNLPDFWLPTAQVAAFHLLPPASEPPDYEETEKNRKLEPLVVLVGNFRFNAHMRMSTNLSVGTNLEVSKITFMSLYDIEISNPYIPSMGTLKVPMTLVRTAAVAYGLKG